MNPDHQSIFGDTYNGVPNPYTPHWHPYPSRFHGMRPNSDMRSVPATFRHSSVAVSPFGGLSESQPLFQALTGNWMVDAAIGAAVGYMGSAKKEEALLHGVAGAVVVGVVGTLGLIGLLGYELMNNKR